MYDVGPLKRYEITWLIENEGGGAFGQTRYIDRYKPLGLTAERQKKVESCAWGENDFRRQRQYVRVLVSSSACMYALYSSLKTCRLAQQSPCTCIRRTLFGGDDGPTHRYFYTTCDSGWGSEWWDALSFGETFRVNVSWTGTYAHRSTSGVYSSGVRKKITMSALLPGRHSASDPRGREPVLGLSSVSKGLTLWWEKKRSIDVQIIEQFSCHPRF